MAPVAPSGSNSSDYYDNDPAFLAALEDVDLGDPRPQLQSDPTSSPKLDDDPQSSTDLAMPPCTQPGLKRRRLSDTEEEDEVKTGEAAELHKLGAVDESYTSSFTYGASRFGEFGEYMARKRAKLQIQNAEIDGDEGQEKNKIFKGVQIYINGWTEPSVQNLRTMIIEHGGIFHAYLDKKSLVTHIITCSLTPAKIKEFKHMKVVRPEWMTESIKAGVLLPWHDFIFRPGERTEESQGKKVGQKSLFDGFVSQSRQPASTKAQKRSSKNEQSAASGSAADESPQPLSTPPTPSPATPPRTPTRPNPMTPSRSKLYTTDPVSPSQASRVPGYAAHVSNPYAQRAMADPAWRAAHTSAAPDFIEGYYRNSRMHHLSTWKAELKNLVQEAQERVDRGGADAWEDLPKSSQGAVGKIMAENLKADRVRDTGGENVSMRGAQLVMRSPGKGKEKADDPEERVIMHCDFDSFFVSAGLVDRPHLRGKPVVVCHSQGGTGGAASTSEIASASYEARKFGIKSGMSLQQARKLCPAVMTIPYEFQLYKKFSLQFYTVLMVHADDLQAVSVDEALIDVTSSLQRIRAEISRSQGTNSTHDPAKEFAEAIRAQVRKVTGCEISIGIANNIMLARLASRRAKPAGSFYIFPSDVTDILTPLDIDDLHGFGYSARQKAEEKLGTTNLGELMKKSKGVLCDALGKTNGETLYKALRGIDDRKLESDKPRKSVSCDINYGIRFENSEQAETFIFQLAAEVSRRLNEIDMRGRSLTLKVLKRDPGAPVEAPKFMGHGMCESYNKQVPLIGLGGRATSDEKIIGEHAWRLLKSFNFDPRELRGIGIQIQKLEKSLETAAPEPGQAVLPYKKKGGKKDVAEVASDAAFAEELPDPAAAKDVEQSGVEAQVPSQDSDIQIIEPPRPPIVQADTVDLPNFSQVDKSVFQVLPEDIRKELETEYVRRSVTPAPVAGPSGVRSRSASVAARRRSVSIFPERKTFKITVKGTNVKRITQQLAPRSRATVSPTKSTLFAKRLPKSAPSVTERELYRLGIDPEVFVMLPPDLQREQLAGARAAIAPGAQVFSQRKELKPRKPKPPLIPYRRAPPPRARYLAPPTLKQQGKTKGEKLYFTKTDDLQRVIEAWVDDFRERPPNQRDVDFFAKFLVQCVDGTRSTDTGLERAVAVAKWWLILLRRHFGMWEHPSEFDEVTDSQPDSQEERRVTSEAVGKAWWKAFREVKGKMDEVARKKFGGCLSLK